MHAIVNLSLGAAGAGCSASPQRVETREIEAAERKSRRESIGIILVAGRAGRFTVANRKTGRYLRAIIIGMLG